MHPLPINLKDMSFIEEKIQKYLKEGSIDEKNAVILSSFCQSYLTALQTERDLSSSEHLLHQLIDFVKQFYKNPHLFSHYHAMRETPYNYYLFGLNMLRPLIHFEQSKLLGLPFLHKIAKQIQDGENCIFLANHQTEADPQILDLILSPYYPVIAKNMIFVAGSRVTTDPFSIPFSLGRNLLCIYSKKYIDTPPQLREQKQRHNRQTMNVMRTLLTEGGKCIYVAPSGGRDRLAPSGIVEVASFDPNSVEMFRMVAGHADQKTHFYPLALNTYSLLPPPQEVHEGLGEARTISICGVGVAIGDEIDLNAIECPNKIEARALRAQAAQQAVILEYQKL